MSYCFIFDDAKEKRVPVDFDFENKTLKVYWSSKTVELYFRYVGNTIWALSQSLLSLGPGGDEVIISPMGGVTYTLRGCGVPRIGQYHGKLVYIPVK
jgi:hypothetical protein